MSYNADGTAESLSSWFIPTSHLSIVLNSTCKKRPVCSTAKSNHLKVQPKSNFVSLRAPPTETPRTSRKLLRSPGSTPEMPEARDSNLFLAARHKRLPHLPRAGEPTLKKRSRCRGLDGFGELWITLENFGDFGAGRGRQGCKAWAELRLLCGFYPP